VGVMGVSIGDGNGGGVDGPRSRQGAGTETSIPESCLRRRRSYETFHGRRLIDLGFTRREASYRRKGEFGGGQVAPDHP
jgi:hypothetical protein